mmetsp:Transcript_4228/g.12424  ORF Transcript_4228/g.12424 Transcript_4228/m.12424 type:complete len:347 (+) Transcript_4228:72-1112(+)
MHSLASALGYGYRHAVRDLPGEHHDLLVPLRDLMQQIALRLRPDGKCSLRENLQRAPPHVGPALDLLAALAGGSATCFASSSVPAPSTPITRPRSSSPPTPVKRVRFDIPGDHEPAEAQVHGDLPEGSRPRAVRFGSQVSVEFAASGSLDKRSRQRFGEDKLPEACSVSTTTLRHPGRARARRRRQQNLCRALFLLALRERSAARRLAVAVPEHDSPEDDLRYVDVAAGPDAPLLCALDRGQREWLRLWVCSHRTNLDDIRVKDGLAAFEARFGRYTDEVRVELRSSLRLFAAELRADMDRVPDLGWHFPSSSPVNSDGGSENSDVDSLVNSNDESFDGLNIWDEM